MLLEFILLLIIILTSAHQFFLALCSVFHKCLYLLPDPSSFGLASIHHPSKPPLSFDLFWSQQQPQLREVADQSVHTFVQNTQLTTTLQARPARLAPKIVHHLLPMYTHTRGRNAE